MTKPKVKAKPVQSKIIALHKITDGSYIALHQDGSLSRLVIVDVNHYGTTPILYNPDLVV